MLTPDLVLAQSNSISATNKVLLIMLLRKNPLAQLQITQEGDDIATRIDLAQGTDKAKMLNALLQLVNEVGGKRIEIRRDDDALYYSTKENLDEISNEIFYILYDFDPTLSSGGVSPSSGVYGNLAAIGQRCPTGPVCNSCGCIPCSGISTCSDRRKPRHWLDTSGVC